MAVFWANGRDFGTLGLCPGGEKSYDAPRLHWKDVLQWGETASHPNTNRTLGGIRDMAARRKKAARRSGPADLIISKARVKAAAKKCNVGSDFYPALDKAVREIIKGAEGRAVGNKRKTLKPVDL